MAESGGRRLDPFALPSETSGRFRMLMILALILAWSLSSQIVPVPNLLVAAFDVSPEVQQIFDRAKERVRSGSLAWPPTEPAETIKVLTSPDLRRTVGYLAKQALRAALSLFFLAMLAVATTAIYWVFPGFLGRKLQIRPIEDKEAPKVVGELRRMAASVGLARIPNLAVRPGFLDGLAFGHSKSQTLVVAGEPSQLQKSWNNLHRSVALHELGHIVNDDIRNREVLRAIWLAYAMTLVLAAVLFLAFGPNELRLVGRFGWQTCGALVAAWSIWGGLVRAREFYADWRVETWGFGDALALRLKIPSAIEVRGLRGRLGRFLPWRMHPSNSDRLEVLRNAGQLFRPSLKLAVLTGVLLGLLTGNAGGIYMDLVSLLFIIAGYLSVGTGSLLILIFVAAILLVFLPLASAILSARWIGDALGVQLLRSSLHDLELGGSKSWGYLRLIGIALTLGAGIEIGLLLTPAGNPGWTHPLFLALWTVIFVGLLWIWLMQTRALGRLILGASSSLGALRKATRLARWIATIQLAAFLWPALIGRISLQAAESQEILAAFSHSGQSTRDLFATLAGSAFLLLTAGFLFNALLGLAVFALADLWLRRRKVACPTCASLIVSWRFAGNLCNYCGEPLAPWLYCQEVNSIRDQLFFEEKAQ